LALRCNQWKVFLRKCHVDIAQERNAFALD
jgi:hypothetical protein